LTLSTIGKSIASQIRLGFLGKPSRQQLPSPQQKTFLNYWVFTKNWELAEELSIIEEQEVFHTGPI
jgi:hypothetical protein